MSYQELLRRTIGAVFVALLLAGCSAQASTPTPFSPTFIQTAVPPTNNPISLPPTTTPTAVPPTSVPTPAFTLATSITDIVGIWQSPTKGLYFRFFEDGILHQAHSLDRLDTEPYAISEIWFEGTLMYLKEKVVSGVPSCGADPAIYEVHLLSGGHIQIVKVEEKCSPRAGDTALKLAPVR